MWYEIIPSFGVIMVGLALPHASAYVINKLAIGNSYRRCLRTDEQEMQYIRDRRLTDNPYKLAGLENIPSQ